ncbi:hypothetical protein D3C76_1198460 [compost metagenome]
MQDDLHRFRKRIQALPGEIQPIKLDIGIEALLPIQPAVELETLLGTGAQVQGGNVCPLGIDPTLQHQADRALLGRQAGKPCNLITGLEVALPGQFDLVQLQRIGQVSARFESVGNNAHLGRQVLGQRLDLATQATLEVTLAVTFELQALEQVTLDRQR